MKRRDLLLASAALAAAPVVARAQTRVPVLGILLPAPKPTPEALAASIAKGPFSARLRELGWVEGKTLRVERVFSGATLDQLPEAAASLVAKKVDVIWTASPPAAVAVARATKTIPIVFWRVGFAIESGLIDSYARPGRNVTGVAWFVDEDIYRKGAQTLKEMVPTARRMVTMDIKTSQATVSGGTVDFSSLRERTDATLRGLGFEHVRVAMSNESGLEPALAAIEKLSPDSLRVPDVPLTVRFRKSIVDFARRHKLYDVYETREWTAAGGLVSYGIVFLPTLLRTADMVDRILRGAKPADIPVELPSHYELVINLKTARSLGLTVPQSVLLRADRVIE